MVSKITMNKSISVMVPAYNEEKKLKNVILSLEKLLRKYFSDYEILIFDDCSTDKTYAIANKFAKKNKKIKVIHNEKNMGLGYNFRKGIEIAKKKYYTWVPGDDETDMKSFEKTLTHVGKEDIIIPFTKNKNIRSFKRRFVSDLYVKGLNLLFNLSLKYYNGLNIYKTKSIKNLRITTNSFAYQAEIIVPLLKQGHSYKEVPLFIKPTEETTIFRLKNIIGVIFTILKLFFRINIKRDY